MSSLYFILGIKPGGLSAVNNAQPNGLRRGTKVEGQGNIDNTQTVFTVDNTMVKHPFEVSLNSNERKFDLLATKF